MITPSPDQIEALKAEWTDKYVQVNPDRAELKRFVGRVGRVVTVNFTGKALIDFADGGWYDITAAPDCLTVVEGDAVKKYDPKANSAQAKPERQG